MLFRSDRLGDGVGSTRSSAVIVSGNRVVLASVLSGGLYLLYWFYITWKQLSRETENTHYPVWHALTLLVPIYGLFRMHAHVRLINELAFRHRIAETFGPSLAVVLLVLSNVLDWASIGRSEEHTSELQSQAHPVCRLLPEKTKHTHTHKQH